MGNTTDAQSKKPVICNWSIDNEVVINTQFDARTLHCSPDGQYFAYSQDTVIRIYDPKQRKHIGNELKGSRFQITTLKYSPDGSLIAASGNTIFNAKIHIWETKSQAQVQMIEGINSGITSLAFSPNGLYIVAGCSDRTIRIQSLKNGIQTKLLGHSAMVSSIDYQTSYIASGSLDKTIRLWRAQNGSNIRKIHGLKNSVTSIKSKESIIVAGNRDSRIRLWNQQRGSKLMRVFRGHRTIVNSIDISPDSNFILSGSDDETARIWNCNTGQHNIINLKDQWVSMVTFSSDGKYLIFSTTSYYHERLRIQAINPVIKKDSRVLNLIYYLLTF